MTHEQAIERLDDFATGELPDIDRLLVQRHLDGCDECRAEVAAIRALLQDAALLPAGIAPPADLWGAVAARLEPRRGPVLVGDGEVKVIPLAPRKTGWQAPPRWAMQIAAAAVLVVGSSAITARVMREGRQQPAAPGTLGPVAVTAPVRRPNPAVEAGTAAVIPSPENPQAVAPSSPAAAQQGTQATFTSSTRPAVRGGASPVTALAAFRPAEREYQRAIDDLARVLDTRRSQLSPETVSTLEKNLRIIDSAIAESRAALENDPNSRELTQMLSATYEAKVQTLRQAVEL